MGAFSKWVIKVRERASARRKLFLEYTSGFLHALPAKLEVSPVTLPIDEMEELFKLLESNLHALAKLDRQLNDMYRSMSLVENILYWRELRMQHRFIRKFLKNAESTHKALSNILGYRKQLGE